MPNYYDYDVDHHRGNKSKLYQTKKDIQTYRDTLDTSERMIRSENNANIDREVYRAIQNLITQNADLKYENYYLSKQSKNIQRLITEAHKNASKKNGVLWKIINTLKKYNTELLQENKNLLNDNKGLRKSIAKVEVREKKKRGGMWDRINELELQHSLDNIKIDMQDRSKKKNIGLIDLV